jgi:hypothetical protein
MLLVPERSFGQALRQGDIAQKCGFRGAFAKRPCHDLEGPLLLHREYDEAF